MVGGPLGHGAWTVAGSHGTSRAFDWTGIRRAWTFARPYRGLVVLLLGAIVTSALLGLIPPLAFRAILDRAIPQHDNRLLAVLAALAATTAIASTALALLQTWCSSRVGEGLVYEMRIALFDKVQRMPLAFFARTQTGALLNRLNADVVGAQHAVTGTLTNVVSNTVTITTTLTAMVVLEWRLTLLALAMLPLFLAPARRVGRRLQIVSRERMNLGALMNSRMTERFNVSGALLVKHFGRYADESTAFARCAGRVRDISIGQAMYGRLFFAALGLIGAMATVAIYGLGGRLVISGAISAGTLVALATFATQIYGPLQSLTVARVDLMTALVSFERVFEVLDAPLAVTDRPGAVDLEHPTGHIEFDHVWFRYPAAADVSVPSLERPGLDGELPVVTVGVDVLREVSLTVEPGQVIALVGPSGAGKTTLVSLVPRLYDVSSGTLRLDGRDVRDITGESLRAAIGVASQDPHMFHVSVRDNLRYARPNATDEDLEAACRAARIHDLIAGLPEGYDTVVGERGCRLSGGEKQRIAIARVLLKDPAIVILDEATCHLDTENEHLIQEALDRALTGRTAIVIAHRLSTVRNADMIVVLEDGSVVESGTHHELLASGGRYSDLYQTFDGV